jgi:hypothetical protein
MVTLKSQRGCFQRFRGENGQEKCGDPLSIFPQGGPEVGVFFETKFKRQLEKD